MASPLTCSCGQSIPLDKAIPGSFVSCPGCGNHIAVPAFDLFLSYSSKDVAIANAACAAVESGGLRCWMAPRNIVSGQEWGAAIIEGIESSRAFLLLLSSHSNQSPQVVREVERAVNKRLPIVTVRIEDMKPNKALEYFISAQHWLDAWAPPLDQHLERLAVHVRQLLDGQVAPLPPVADWRASLPAAVRALLARDRRPRVLLALTGLLIVASLLLAGAMLALRPASASGELIQTKVQAETLWGQIKDLDRQQGIGQRLDALSNRLRIGQAFFEQKSFREALAAFKHVNADGQAIALADQQRQQALALRTEAARARTGAEGAGAPQDAAALWSEAERQWQEAGAAFEAGDFVRAAANWQAGPARFAEATERARRRQQAQTARAAADAARQSAVQAGVPEEAGAAPWSEAQQRAQQASTAFQAEDHNAAAEHWNAAAARFAQAASLATERRGRRQRAQTCREATETAWKAAAEACVPEHAAALWSEAEQRAQQADAAFKAGDYTAAADHWQAAAERLNRGIRRLSPPPALQTACQEFQQWDRWLKTSGYDGEKVLQLAAAAEKAIQADDLDEAERRYCDANQRVVGAVWPRLKYLAVQLGYIAQYSCSNNKPDPDRLARLMLPFEAESMQLLGAPASLLESIPKAGSYKKGMSVADEVSEAVGKRYGEEIHAAFRVTFDLRAVYGHLSWWTEDDDRFPCAGRYQPGTIADAKRELLEKLGQVKNTAMKARFPKRILAKLDELLAWVDHAEPADCFKPENRNHFDALAADLWNFDGDYLPIQPIEWGIELMRDSPEPIARAGAEPVYAGKTLKQWQQQLTSTEARDRCDAVLALGQIGPAATPALKALTGLVQDPDRIVRALTMTALARIDAATVPQLIAALRDDKELLVRKRAANALGSLGDNAKEAVPALVAVGELQTDVQLCCAVIDALGQIGPAARAAVPALIDRLGCPETQYKAHLAIVRIGPAAALPLLAKALGPTDYSFASQNIQEYAAVTLEDMGPALGQLGPEHRDVVVALLSQVPYRGVGEAASRALVKWGPKVVPLLRELSNDKEPWIRQNADRILKQIKQ